MSREAVIDFSTLVTKILLHSSGGSNDSVSVKKNVATVSLKFSF